MKYRHYKGNEYEVITNAKHSESGEELVVYRRTDGTAGVWARPFSLFHGFTDDGKKRFQFVEEVGADES